MQKEIIKIQTQIAQTKKELNDNQAELEGLRMERAKVSLQKNQGARLTELNKLIAQKHYDVDCAPDVIVELEKQLTEAKAVYAVEDRDRLLTQHKAAAEQAMKLSKQLVEQLRLACKTNKELHAAYARNKQLQEMTNMDFLGVRFAEPSAGMLEYLYGFLRGELEDGRHCRPLRKEAPLI